VTLRPHAHRRAGLLALLGLSLGVLLPVAVAGPASAATTKTSICHATNSHTNPYRRITVSQNALNPHGNHHGVGAVWNQGITTRWDDVIPDASRGGSNGAQLSWTAAGIAVYDGVTKTAAGTLACRGMSTKAYYDSEIAAGVPQAAVLTDLNSQAANEDAALLAALGGEFTVDNVGLFDAVRATTLSATHVASSSATLSGSVTLGRDTVSSTTAEQAALSFTWGTDPNLLGASSASATPATATGSTSGQQTTLAGAALTDLLSGQIYYYRLVAVTDGGLETEAVLEGAIHTFTTTGTTPQSLAFEAGTVMEVGEPGRDYAFAGTASGNPVVLTSSNAETCTSTGHVVTPVAPGTCTLTASVAGSATYAPASATDSFSVSAAPEAVPDPGQPPADDHPVTPPVVTPPVETPVDPAPAVTPVITPPDQTPVVTPPPATAPPVTPPSVTPPVTPRPTRAAPTRAIIRDTPRTGLVSVPARLPKDGGRMRRTTQTTRSAKGLVAPLSTTLGPGALRPGQAVTLPGQFLFDFNSPRLTPKGHAVVKALVQNLRGSRAVTCEGYTDYAGDRRHELQLSRQRSLAVCNALKAYGAQVRTATQGFAGAKPVLVGGKAPLRHENRRVVVVVNR